MWRTQCGVRKSWKRLEGTGYDVWYLDKVDCPYNLSCPVDSMLVRIQRVLSFVGRHSVVDLERERCLSVDWTCWIGGRAWAGRTGSCPCTSVCSYSSSSRTSSGTGDFSFLDKERPRQLTLPKYDLDISGPQLKPVYVKVSLEWSGLLSWERSFSLGSWGFPDG